MVNRNGRRSAVTVVACTAIVGSLGLAQESRSQTLSLGVKGPFAVLPCQGLSLLLRIDSVSPLGSREWQRVVAELSQEVLVDDVVFGNRLPTSGRTEFHNDAVRFRMVPFDDGEQPTRNGEREYAECLVVAHLLGNPKTGTCLFGDAGVHSVVFEVRNSVLNVDVEVLSPTAAEASTAEALRRADVMLFLSDPSDRQYRTSDVVATLRAHIVEGSRYSQPIAAAVGISMMQDSIALKDDSQAQRAGLDGLLATYEVLSIGTSAEEVLSDNDALCVYYRAIVAGRLLGKEVLKDKREEYAAERGQCLRSLSGSPFNTTEVRRHLAELKRAANVQE